MWRRIKYLFAILFVFVYSLGVFFVFTREFVKTYDEKILPGVFFADQDAKGWNKQTFQREIEKMEEKKLSNRFFLLNYEGLEWSIKAKDLGLHFDKETLWREAYQAGRGQNFFWDFLTVINLTNNKKRINPKIEIDAKKLTQVLSPLRDKITVAPINALFEMQNGKVTAFQFAKNGLKIDENALKKEILNKFSQDTQIISLLIPTVEVLPQFSNDQADSFGIKTLLASGQSFYTDSIPSRVYNIRLASSKFHGILIKPGETFSFLKHLGEVNKLQGYKEAYIIKNGKTVLGDGGGVCQVSTTIYRAALKSGLPIVERAPHAYRVGYYEPPLGFDATVYQPGGPDLKFKNDTPGHILIQIWMNDDTQTLTVEFYGTSDGRVTEISDPVVVSTTAPPPTRYEDDPTLAQGVEKQVDTAHSGAKVFFTRRVTRDNETLINEKIWSNYIPWAAVVLRGTKS